MLWIEKFLQQLRNISSQGSFLKRVVTLSGGTAIAQAITILSMPVLTRLYMPDDLGKFGLFLTFLQVVTVPASLMYEPAVVVAEEKQEAAYVVALSLIIAFLMTPLTALLFYCLVHFQLLGFGSLSKLTMFIVVGTFILTSFFSVLRYWFIRENTFVVLSQVVIIQNVTKSIGQMSLAFLPLQMFGLVLGELAGKCMGMRHVLSVSRREILPHLQPFDVSKVKLVAFKYRDFPRYSLPSSLINILANNLTLPMLVFLYGNRIGGYFLLAQRLLNLPLRLISSSVADVFYTQMSDYVKHQPNKVKKFFLSVTHKLFGVSFLMVLFICLAGILLFKKMFGDAWEHSLEILLLMAPWAFCALIVSPLSRLVFVLGQQRGKLIYDLVSLTLQVLIFLASLKLNLSLSSTLSLTSFGFSISYLVYFIILLNAVTKFSKRTFNASNFNQSN